MIDKVHPLQHSNTLEERVEILCKELEMSVKWHRPAILLAICKSENIYTEVATIVEQHLHQHGQEVMHLHLDKTDREIFGTLQKSNTTDGMVYFLDGFKFPVRNKETYELLDEYANTLEDRKVRGVFWLAQNDAAVLAHQAPEFWISCQRILVFEELVDSEQIFQRALEMTWQGTKDATEYMENGESPASIHEDWLADLPQDYAAAATRANLLLSLGILNWRKGELENAENLLQNALHIARKIQNSQLEVECYNAMALVNFSLGNHSEAIEAYRRAIHLAPNQVSTWNHLGNLCLKTQRNDEAMIAFQKTIEHNPEDHVAWNGLGNVYSHLGYTDDAIRAYKKAIEFAPTLPDPWNGLGNVYTTIGQMDSAINAYQKSIKLNQQLSTPWLGLAHLFSKNARDQEAVKAYQQALDVEPRNSVIWNELGVTYLKLGEYQRAANSFSKAIRFDQGYGWAYSNLALAYSYMGKHRESVSLFLRSIERFSSNEEKAESWNRLGDTYRRLCEYDNAVAAYQKADQLSHNQTTNPPPLPAEDAESDLLEITQIPSDADETPAQPLTIHTVLTEPLKEKKDSLAGLKPPSWLFTDRTPPHPLDANRQNVPSSLPAVQAEHPTGKQPASHKAQTGQARPKNKILGGETGETAMQIATPKFQEVQDNAVDVNLREKELNTKFSEDAIQKPASTNALAWNEKGNVHIQAGDYAAAIKAYRKAIDADRSFGWPINNLAFACLKSGKLEEALTLYFKGIEILTSDHEKAVCWNGVGFIHRCQGDYQGAMDAFQKADELDPNNAGFHEDVNYQHADPNPQNLQMWNDLGDMFFKAGDYEEAAIAYNQTVGMNPASGTCLSNLALALVFQGRYQDAVHYYQKSIPLFKEDKEKAVAWNRLGNAYRKLNDYDNAISAYQNAVKLNNEPVNLLSRARFSLLSNCYVD